MINEFVYCPRLFYYEVVDGVFVESADTLRGAGEHRRVDSGKGALPKPKGGRGKKKEEKEKEEGASTETTEPEIIHSRSVQLGSSKLGVTAKLDLVEVSTGAGGVAESVAPVEYKSGRPRQTEEGIQMWDADKVQLGLQMWLLRENGYFCEEGVIYYKETRQRSRLAWSGELEEWIAGQVNAARACMSGPRPAPLVDSPKCPRCSLAPVCLPDETNWLRAHVGPGQPLAVIDGPPGTGAPPPAHPPAPRPPVLGEGDASAVGRTKLPRSAPGTEGAARPRLLLAAVDERRAAYFNTPGASIGIRDRVLVARDREQALDPIRLQDINHLALFGNVQISSQAISALAAEDIPITHFSTGGFFHAVTHGHGLKNVMTRIEQFRAASDPVTCLALAKQMVTGKVRNQRTFLNRNHAEPPTPVLLRLNHVRKDVERAGSIGELLGIEGAAAALYFEHFSGMLRPRQRAETEGVTAVDADSAWSFDFRGRNRRPPRDPVNALLSLAYSLLAKDFTIAAYAVGFDPYVGFYHQPRFGRPALALDMMEEFRSLIADSAVLTAINNGAVTTKDFVRAGEAVNLTPGGRRAFFEIYEKRVSGSIRHPVFGYDVSYRRAFELQYRLLARALTGETADYVPFTTR
jgi:CRISPR-associated protein Cas1